MKKVLSILLTLVTLFGVMSVFAVPASAASTTAFDTLTTTEYAKVYTLSSSGKTIPYMNTNLTTRGSITYGKSSTAYIDNKTDELYLCDVGKNSNGTYWAKVSYPIGSKRAYAYIALSAITGNNGSHAKTTASGKFYCSYRKGVSTSSSYYVAKGDTVYLIATSGSDYQILYPISGGKWRIGWCSKSNYNKYCVNNPTPTPPQPTVSTSFNPVWPCKNSNYISTMYRYYNSGNPKNHGVRSNIYNAFDVAGSSGDTIYAIEKGTVVDKGYQSSGFGYYVVIKHQNGLYSLYAHLKSSAKVSVGASVSRKQVIGYMGTTGNSSGNHLHFELYNPNNYSKVINPWTTYYQGKVSVTVGGNSYRANTNYKSDSYAQSWCNWLKNNCKKNSSGDYVFSA